MVSLNIIVTSHRFKNCSICLVITGIDIGFNIMRNLSLELLNTFS
jgi:hypothetical protein